MNMQTWALGNFHIMFLGGGQDTLTSLGSSIWGSGLLQNQPWWHPNPEEKTPTWHLQPASQGYGWTKGCIALISRQYVCDRESEVIRHRLRPAAVTHSCSDTSRNTVAQIPGLSQELLCPVASRRARLTQRYNSRCWATARFCCITLFFLHLSKRKQF